MNDNPPKPKDTSRILISSLLASTLVISAVSWVKIENYREKIDQQKIDNNFTSMATKQELKKLRDQLAAAKITISDLTKTLSDTRNTITLSSNVKTNSTHPENSLDTTKPNFMSENKKFEAALSANLSGTSYSTELESIITDIEASYWQETYDTQWSTDIGNYLVTFLEKQSIPDTSLGKTECHSSLCLVEFIHEDSGSHDILLQHLGSMRPLANGFLVKTDESDYAKRTLVYFPRQGESLSAFTQNFTQP